MPGNGASEGTAGRSPARSEPGIAGTVRLEIGLEAALHVDVFPVRVPLVDGHDLRQRAAQVPGHPLRQLGGADFVADELNGHLEQLPEISRQLAHRQAVGSAFHPRL
jgi:hypothetical protein